MIWRIQSYLCHGYFPRPIKPGNVVGIQNDQKSFSFFLSFFFLWWCPIFSRVLFASSYQMILINLGSQLMPRQTTCYSPTASQTVWLSKRVPCTAARLLFLFISTTGILALPCQRGLSFTQWEGRY